jgi:hypothetical protein
VRHRQDLYFILTYLHILSAYQQVFLGDEAGDDYKRTIASTAEHFKVTLQNGGYTGSSPSERNPPKPPAKLQQTETALQKHMNMDVVFMYSKTASWRLFLENNLNSITERSTAEQPNLRAMAMESAGQLDKWGFLHHAIRAACGLRLCSSGENMLSGAKMMAATDFVHLQIAAGVSSTALLTQYSPDTVAKFQDDFFMVSNIIGAKIPLVLY